MKTRSLIGFLPLLASMFAGGTDAQPVRNISGYSGNSIFIPRHGKFKGWMKENRRYKSLK
jgi:hypothetical protein